MPIKLNFSFDPETYRHSINGHPSVLHCHHYMSLLSKLAVDTADFGGTRILREVAEDSIRPMLDDYFEKEGVTDPEERFRVGEEYYSVMGMGRISVSGDAFGGEVAMLRSHVDEGWVKKWGKHNQHINHFTCGYLAALFGAVFNKSSRSYTVTETASIVAGDPEGKLVVKAA